MTIPKLHHISFGEPTKASDNTVSPCLVVLHGLFGEASNWRQLAQQWGQQYWVIAFDLPNHGQSFRSPSMAYPEMAKNVLASMSALGIKQAHVLGHSMGGKVAMQMALMAPKRLQSLIIADIAPVAYRQDRHDSIFAGLLAVDLTTIVSRKQALWVLNQHISDYRVCQFLAKSLYKTPEQTYAWRFNLPVLRSEYANICNAPAPIATSNHVLQTPFNQPVLIVKGALSDYIQKQHQPAFAKLFPQAKVKIIATAGHWLHAEKPAIFSRIVDRFVGEVDSG